MLGPEAPILTVPEVVLFAEIVPRVAVPVDAVILDPNVTAPSWSGIVAVLMVAVPTESVPIVAVPVEAVRLEPNVIAPSCRGIVAVLIVAVLIVAVPIVDEFTDEVPMLCVPTERVPMVAVPVDAVKLVPKVTGPERVVLLETVKDPVLCTPEVEIERAEEVLSPSVMT